MQGEKRVASSVETHDVDHRVEVDEEHDGRDQVCDKGDHEEHDTLLPEHPPKTRATWAPRETGEGDEEDGEVGEHGVEVDEGEVDFGDSVDAAGVEFIRPIGPDGGHSVHLDAPKAGSDENEEEDDPSVALPNRDASQHEPKNLKLRGKMGCQWRLIDRNWMMGTNRVDAAPREEFPAN